MSTTQQGVLAHHPLWLFTKVGSFPQNQSLDLTQNSWKNKASWNHLHRRNMEAIIKDTRVPKIFNRSRSKLSIFLSSRHDTCHFIALVAYMTVDNCLPSKNRFPSTNLNGKCIIFIATIMLKISRCLTTEQLSKSSSDTGMGKQQATICWGFFKKLIISSSIWNSW